MSRIYIVLMCFIILFPVFSSMKGDMLFLIAMLSGILMIIFWEKFRKQLLKDKVVLGLMLGSYTISIFISIFNVIEDDSVGDAFLALFVSFCFMKPLANFSERLAK